MEKERGEGYPASVQRRGREENEVRRIPLAYDDLFKVESGKKPVRKVLVEGDAGIGKTILCVSVSEDWANGELFQQFKLVLLLPLRIKAIAEAGSLNELLRLLHPSQRLCESMARCIEDEEGENMLIIADGWDELSEAQRLEESFLYRLLFQLFPFMSLVVTSRPFASAPLHKLPNVDRVVEIRGFSKENILEYIQSEFRNDGEKADRLFEQLQNNPLVESVCSVPLNCAIVCHLWRTLEEALPTTMTLLHRKLILNVVFRNLCKVKSYNTLSSLSDFDALPVDLQQPWLLLCQFAFQALVEDQIVFSQKELIEFFPKDFSLDRKVFCFGLLQSTESILDTGYGLSFHFLHTTFQEYLAAVYLARQPQDKILKFFQSHNDSCSDFTMLWRFFFGIFFHLSKTNTKYIDIDSEAMLKCMTSTKHYSWSNLHVCHCGFEAQNESVNEEIIHFLVRHPPNYQSIPIKIDFGEAHTAHDCAAVLYIISNMQKSDGMHINFASCGIREKQIQTLIDLLSSRAGKLQITWLNLSGNKLTIDSLHVLENAVHCDLLSKLQRLDLQRSLTIYGDAYSMWLITFIECLSAHCPLLQAINVSHNQVNVSRTSALAGVLSKLGHNIPRPTRRLFSDREIACRSKDCRLPSFLSKLELSIANHSCKDLLVKLQEQFSEHICTESNDESDRSCKIFMVGTHRALAHDVCCGNMQVRISDLLNFSDNPLKLEGTLAIGKILSSDNCQSGTVVLSRCELTAVGGGLPNLNSLYLSDGTSRTVAVRDVGQQLCQMPQSSIITWLHLDGNSFTGTGIHILAGFIHLCPYLEYLHTCNCSINSDDLIWLLGKLDELKSSSPNLCSRLKVWHLIGNMIDDRGVSAIANYLPSLFVDCPRIIIVVYNNPITTEIRNKLQKEWKRYLPVRVLQYIVLIAKSLAIPPSSILLQIIQLECLDILSFPKPDLHGRRPFSISVSPEISLSTHISEQSVNYCQGQ